MVQFLLFVLSLFWFAVSVRNRNLLLDVYFPNPRLKVLWRIHSRNSLQKFEGVTNCTRGIFFYLSPLLNILHFGLSMSHCDVGFETSRRQFNPPLERRDVGSQRPDVIFVLLWNVMTLDLNVATLFLITLWNVATLGLNIAALAAFLSGTSRRCIRTLRRCI